MKKRRDIYIIVRSQADGKPLRVVRPAPGMVARSLELAKASIGKDNNDGFQAILRECSPYTIVGFFGKYGSTTAIVDRGGKKVGEFEPGDSFVTVSEDLETGSSVDFRELH
jgi:hypothetical protein